jgi:hypothetical protein
VVLGKLDFYMEKHEIGLLFYTIYKNQFKMDLNIWLEPIKLLKEKLRVGGSLPF